MRGSLKYPLQELSTFDLLKVKICDLGLDINQPTIQVPVRQLYGEIASKGLRFRPHVWISTSWFSPYGIPGFAIPFYLLHPRLAELEQKYIGEVEGGTHEWCMQLMRHESGHAIDNAFYLRKSKRRQELFGLSGKAYPLRYAPKLTSRDFVRHLANHYAQAHPDEDWAETFAVWLDPKSHWRATYKGWSALKKLELADELLTNIAGTTPKVFNKFTLDDVNSCTQTLGDYFREKQLKYRKLDPTPAQRHHITHMAAKRWITM